MKQGNGNIREILSGILAIAAIVAMVVFILGMG